MKDFVKMTLAVVCGLLIMTVIAVILGFGAIGALIAAGSGTPAVPKSGVLVMDMSEVVIGEQSEQANPLASVTGSGEAGTVGLWDAVQAINKAALDPGVKYIYLKADAPLSDITALEELRDALSNFRELSGKPIVS